MSATVGQVLACLNDFAPFEQAEAWDNVGLLVGRLDQCVHKVLCALDLTEKVLDEAVSIGAELIVTHHPVMFRGRRNLREDDCEGRLLCNLVRANIALIAMHTNFDNGNPGVNDALAEKLGLKDVQALENGMRLGSIESMTFKEFKDRVENRLGGAVRGYGENDRRVQRVAVLGGAGEDFLDQARIHGADVYVTGEVAYHKGMDSAFQGLMVIEAGHAATEAPGVNLLCRGLQNALNAVQYNIRVLESQSELFL